MKRNLITGGIIAIVAIGLIAVVLNKVAESRITKALEKVMEGYALQYDDISVNVLQGNTSLSNPSFKRGEIAFEAERIQLRDLDYTDYIFHGNITIDLLEIHQPEVAVNKQDSLSGAKAEEDLEQPDPEIELLIKRVAVIGGSLKMVENDTAVPSLFLSIVRWDTYNVEYGTNTSHGFLPFEYRNTEITSDSISLEMNDEHRIVIAGLDMKENRLQVRNLEIIPKFQRAEFDRQIPYEKDRVELLVKSIEAEAFEWESLGDTLLIKSPLTTIDQASLQLYRNKLLPDDRRIKPLYSQMIRELGIKVKFDTLKVRNSEIVYEENVKESRPPAEISFSEVEATIHNLSNIAMDSENFPITRIEAHALFMESSPLSMDLEFDVSDVRDVFQVSGQMGSMSAQAINPFMKPAMNVEAEGVIESLFYNFQGNPVEATGTMQLKYSDFKVNILKDGGEVKKSFLSDLANLIMKNDVVNEEVTQEDIQVERDSTKSFWNYMWLCIRKGALKTFL